MEKQYFAVTPDMVEPLARHRHHRHRPCALSDHHVARRSPHRAGAAGQWRRRAERIRPHQGNRPAPGREQWVRLFTDHGKQLLQGFPGAGGRFGEPQWPDLKHAKIFRLAFRDKGRLIDSTEHPLFQEMGGP